MELSGKGGIDCIAMYISLLEMHYSALQCIALELNEKGGLHYGTVHCDVVHCDIVHCIC